MAKFIEVKLTKDSMRAALICAPESGIVVSSDRVLINVYYIVAILPMGDTCIIRMSAAQDIHADHSAAWVMGLINGSNSQL